MPDELVSFDSPARLLLLALVVLYVFIALVIRRRGERGLVRGAFAVLAVVVLMVGFAGPRVTQRQTRDRATVVLAIDVSNSMRAEDVSPRRFEAAKAAAHVFVDMLPPTITVGLVAFSADARLHVPPTADHAEVKAGIDALALSGGTAIGEAVFESLDALDATLASTPDDPPPTRIVLLSDGATTGGRSNESAAAAAERAGVPVSTIGFGTDEGFFMEGRTREPAPVDREALERIAEDTRGTYYAAATAAELESVYRDIGSAVSFDTDLHDLSWWCTGVALILLGLAGLASFSRGRRAPAPVPPAPATGWAPAGAAPAPPPSAPAAVNGWVPAAPAPPSPPTGWAPADNRYAGVARPDGRP